jgi:hypothetical protein
VWHKKLSVELIAVTRVLKAHSTERRQFMTWWTSNLFSIISKFKSTICSTEYRHPVRKWPSLLGRKTNPNPKFIVMTETYFVCRIGPYFQVSLNYAFIALGVRCPWYAEISRIKNFYKCFKTCTPEPGIILQNLKPILSLFYNINWCCAVLPCPTCFGPNWLCTQFYLARSIKVLQWKKI